MNISKLNNLLKTRNITQKDISSKIGISQNAFSQALKRGDFRISMIEKIAAALNVPVSYFFEESEGQSNFFGETGNVQIGRNNKQSNKNTGADCTRYITEIEYLKKEVKGLGVQLQAKDKENDSLKETIKAKDKIISLLEK